MSTTTRPRRSKPKAKRAASQAQSQTPQVGPGGKPYQPDVAVLEQCAATCNATFAYCLTVGGVHVEEHHLKSLVDCMEVCQLTSSLVSRGSRYGEELMALCANACRDVADLSVRFEDDAHMRACATAARAAEDWCLH